MKANNRTMRQALYKKKHDTTFFAEHADFMQP